MANAQFQTFDDDSAKYQPLEAIKFLQDKLIEYKLDGYLIPHNDEYDNEYLPEDKQHFAYSSGFTGSWGLMLVTKEKAILYCDGRYRIQGKEQAPSSFRVICTSDLSIKEDWEKNLSEFIPEGGKIGFAPKLFSPKTIERFSDYVKNHSISFLPSLGINEMINYHPEKPTLKPIIAHPLKIAGKTSKEKLSLICEKITKEKADYLFINFPESICWLLNIRSEDTPHTPFVLSKIFLSNDGVVYWFIDPKRVTADIRKTLPDNIVIKKEESLDKFIATLKNKKILCDEEGLTVYYKELLDKNKLEIIAKKDPILLEKAKKNEAEQKAVRKAHIRDGRAVIHFLHWLEKNKENNLNEIDIVCQLEEYRRTLADLKDISFDTISGSGKHGAIIHYRTTQKTNRIWKKDELFLCDSGGQYLDGTTDITRVFLRGVATDEMKKRYTQVLKGHLALARAIFPKDITGANLDVLTRQYLWEVGVDYDHGTGHGVGLYLSVHEGPQSISLRSQVKLEEGMLLSNEPGYYKEGHYGIRIENVELIVKKGIPKDGEREMLGFETMTLVPYEIDLMDMSILTKIERKQINDYHKKIYKTYKKDTTFSKEVLRFLKEKTKKI